MWIQDVHVCPKGYETSPFKGTEWGINLTGMWLDWGHKPSSHGIRDRPGWERVEDDGSEICEIVAGCSGFKDPLEIIWLS